MNLANQSRRSFLKQTVASASLLAVSSSLCGAFQPANAREEDSLWKKLPRWRGFNLCEKFTLQQNSPFHESDFQNISDLGFNFVRLPMDYRTWINGDDILSFKESTFAEIDQAIEFGKKYGVHVCLNFHRAPGYTVNTPPEPKSIWEDSEILDICKTHWQTFAERYKGISNNDLSFNLFNEPAGCSEEDYKRVVASILDGIRSEDPNRLVICDGLNWGMKPCHSLRELKVAQATRGYAPMEISHWGASWVNSKDFPPPQWPMTTFNALVPSIGKKEMPERLRLPLSLTGDFKDFSELKFVVKQVSNRANLVVKFNGKENFRKNFVCGPGEGEWKKAQYVEQYKIYANEYDMEISLPLPSDAQIIEIIVEDGDWLTISKISLCRPNGSDVVAIGSPDWQATEQTTLQLVSDKTGSRLIGSEVKDKNWLIENQMKPWESLAQTGVGVMVGEFGAYNKTPHDIVLAWLEDQLSNWSECGWGWSLWNFRGSFGVADSGRTDVQYKEWRGLNIDEKMLALLSQY